MATIRRAIASDAEAACATLRRSISECCHQDHHGDAAILNPWLGNKTPETVRSWITSSDFVAVAEEGATMVGVGMLCNDATIRLCYLLPEARFKGIGKSLLEVLETEARFRGFPAVSLTSTQTAHAFYLRNGYTDQGATDPMFGLRSQKMSKTLPPRAGPIRSF